MPAPRRDLLASVGPLAKALRRVEDEAAAGAGLTMWQYAVLALVHQSPGLNQGAVAARLGYSPNRIIADLDHLQRRRLITRRPAADRRANRLDVTTAGTDVMQQVQREIHRREDELLAGLSPEQRRVLDDAVHSVAETLRADP